MEINPVFLLGNGIPVRNRDITIEVKITSAQLGDTFTFNVNDIITNDVVLVYAAQAFSADQLAFSPGGRPVIASADVTGLTVNLVDRHAANKVNQAPYFDLVSTLNLGYSRMLNPFHLVLDKSFITITNPGTLAAGQSAVFSFMYFTMEDLIRLFKPYCKNNETLARAEAKKFYDSVA
jgi:hypothetical protein